MRAPCCQSSVEMIEIDDDEDHPTRKTLLPNVAHILEDAYCYDFD